MVLQPAHAPSFTKKRVASATPNWKQNGQVLPMIPSAKLAMSLSNTPRCCASLLGSRMEPAWEFLDILRNCRYFFNIFEIKHDTEGSPGQQMNRRKHIIRKQSKNSVKFKFGFQIAQARVHAQRTTAAINFSFCYCLQETPAMLQISQHKAPSMTNASVQHNKCSRIPLCRPFRHWRGSPSQRYSF